MENSEKPIDTSPPTTPPLPYPDWRALGPWRICYVRYQGTGRTASLTFFFNDRSSLANLLQQARAAGWMKEVFFPQVQPLVTTTELEEARDHNRVVLPYTP